MGKFNLAVILLLFTCLSVAAELKNDPKYTDPNYEDPDYYTPAPYKMTKVDKVNITIASERDDYDPQEDCKGFAITPKLAIFYFNHARPVSESDRMHRYVFSSCSAKGTVKFANGDEARWIIQRGGMAFVGMSQGKFKDKTIYLHCDRCIDWSNWLRAAKK
ncbi:hypothetical protein [Collimonas silvisoli]|uniref:hypothetical protein n=1 Tax=Collimonas silvisoli TaxID=2825884 RepID=UPI001B8C5B96|nr:hypothetical protein [Collimonas silvisoli]